MKKLFIFSLLTIVSTFLVGSRLYAGDLKIGGYANIWVPLTDSDEKTKELKTSAKAEVDFSGTAGKTTVRVDLDFPASKYPDGSNMAAEGIDPMIEQAKVVYGVSDSISFTAGVFNSPIGYEAQDAPDKLEFTNGQLFGGRPANLSGVMGSWTSGPLSADLIIANDWRGQAKPQTGYDNSIGARLGWKGASAGLNVGYITSERTKTGPAPKGDGNLINVVLTVAPIAHTGVAFEFLTDDNNDGWGLTAHYEHGAHGLTARYDSVETEGESDASTSLTVALSCKMMEGVITNLEWKTEDPGGTAKSSDHLVLQWVAPF